MTAAKATLGIGFSSTATAEDLTKAVAEALAAAGLGTADIGELATLEQRARGLAFQSLAQEHGWPVTAYPAARLEKETPRLANPSEAVFRSVGCHGVAEAAALAAAGPGARLILPKFRVNKVTVAIAF
ncbi:cobalamin biosynthesis protein [Rhizobium alvei]|uniref:Cobalamin biosynthesis protein n=1 Tax=Rhizobium alvei TaxID=1132659 RepID=A0ABT8YHW6_9HYPH|nr:cobalamin biosynthesis protein [Rhizobium alvei]MDO6963286.1 cobalamin biosynthesis protein [Rhizobium alvei]